MEIQIIELKDELNKANDKIIKLQDSECKLEMEIINLKNKLEELKESKKIINSPNHILSYMREINLDSEQ
tara:strand:+ start:668 stop:877 length:210 start_codon:yes stop_codon:yes gene_type:complete